MAANPNTMSFKETWDNVYQVSHYKVPAYKAIADESLEAKLTKGQKIHRRYATDFYVNDMGADGSYSTQAISDSDEYLTVDTVKEVSFYIKELDEFQADLPVRIKYAQKAMNQVFLAIDSDVFYQAQSGATNTVDDGSLGGTTGNGITVSTGNITSIFTAADSALRLANVIYDPSATWSGQFKVDRMKNMPVGVISSQMYNQLQLYIGGKNTVLGDDMSRNGYIGKYLGFNIFVSNGLTWSTELILTTNPTNGDTITFLNGVTFGGVSQAITFKFASSASAAGDVLIGASATATADNLVTAFGSPLADSGSVWKAFASLTTWQQTFFNNSVISNSSGTVSLSVKGAGNVPVASSLTATVNGFTAAKQVQHCIFGVNNSISLVIQKTPELRIKDSPSARVGYDFITWVPYGVKVFKDQGPMLVDVHVRTDTFTAAPSQVSN